MSNAPNNMIDPRFSNRKSLKNQPMYTVTEEELTMIYNFTNEAEIVAKYMVEKLISLTMTYNNRNAIDEQIPGYCFNFFYKMFQSGLQEEFICFDRDDMLVNKNLVEEPIFYDNKFSGLNDWSGLKQPVGSKIDRSAASYIRVYKKEEHQKEKDAELAALREEAELHPKDGKDSKNHGYLHTQYSTISSKSKESNLNLKAIVAKKTESNNQTSSQTATLSKSQPKLPNPATLMPQHSLNIQEIPEEAFIIIAREEKKKALDKIVADVKQQEMNRKVNAEKTMELMKKTKELNLKNVTTDFSGNPVQVKPVNVERLPDLYLTAKPTKKEENEVQINQRSYVSMDQNQNHNKRGLEKDMTIKDKINKAGLNTSLKTIVGRNPDSDKPHLSMQEKQVIVQPAGSNYDIFVPECGVTIFEAGKSRSGGKDFFQKFGKHSLANYKNMVNNTFQASHTNASLLGFDQSKEVMDKFNKDAVNQSLPAINMRKTLFEQSSKSFNASMENTVKMNTKYGTIKSALDTLEPIHEFEEKKDVENAIMEDIFKNRRYKGVETDPSGTNTSLDFMDRFNSSIMKNNQWGSDYGKKSKSKPTLTMPFKPNVKKIEKEIGKFVAKSKLPRARNYTKVHQDIIVKKDDHVAFYEETIDSNIVVNEGGSLFLKNCIVNGDVENRGDIKTYGTVEFNGKVRTLTKIHSIKHKDTIVHAFNLSG